MTELKLGMIGLDTSHAKVFTRILNDPSYEHQVSGAKVVVAFPGGSPDFKASASRVEGYTNELRDELGVRIVDSPEEVAAGCDAILLTSVDGRVHRKQFERVAPYRLPVFIDKPFTLSPQDARAIADTAKKYGIPWMSCSVRRYADALLESLGRDPSERIKGAECYGPIEFVPTQPGYYWYGIHTVDVLYRLLGTGCRTVTAYSTEESETVTAVWNDGRIGMMRGSRGNGTSGALIHREKSTEFVDTAADRMHKYANLLQAVLDMFRTGKPGVDPEETLEIIRFIEAVNESRETGKAVSL